jgi:hypothetical protein
MSYEEKGAWVYLVASVGAYVAYLVMILGRLAGTPAAEVGYVSLMLWCIGIAIAANIAGRMLFEMAKPSDSYKVDSRDKEINRQGEYVGGLLLAVLMVVPFALTLARADHFWIGNAMYTAFVLYAVTSTTVRIVAYRRGL